MTDLHEISDRVIAEIKETKEYRNYIEALAAVRANPEMFARVNELRERNYVLQRSGSEDMVDCLDALTNEFGDVINNESANRFLYAESSLCRLISEFNTSIVRGLEFD